MLKRVLSAAGAIAMLSLAAGNAGAATILGSVGQFQPYTAYNLDGYTDWAIYGQMAYGDAPLPPPSPTDFTHKTAVSSFAALSTVGGGPYLAGGGGTIKYSHGDAFGTYAPATTGGASEDAHSVAADSGSLSQVSFTHTVLASNETLQVFIVTKAHEQQWVDLSATIGGVGYTSTNQLLPLTNNDDINNGGQGRFAIVNIDISGATVNSTLTFTVTSNYTNNTNPTPAGWWGVGISGATVTAAVPEPTSLALLGLGGVALMGRRRKTA